MLWQRARFSAPVFIFWKKYCLAPVLRSLFDGTDLKQWAQAVRADARLVFFKSISNPTLEVIDLSKVAHIAHANGALVMVDNCFQRRFFRWLWSRGRMWLFILPPSILMGKGACLVA